MKPKIGDTVEVIGSSSIPESFLGKKGKVTEFFTHHSRQRRITLTSTANLPSSAGKAGRTLMLFTRLNGTMA